MFSTIKNLFNNKNRELELKEKELQLKQKELELKEQEINLKKDSSKTNTTENLQEKEIQTKPTQPITKTKKVFREYTEEEKKHML
jgi:hypothetical protein